MRKLAVMLVVGFAASNALGAVVSFNPASVGDAMPGDRLTFEVSIEGTAQFSNFAGMDILFRSTDLQFVMPTTDDFWSAGILANAPIRSVAVPDPLPVGFDNALLVGASAFMANPFSLSGGPLAVVAALEVDVPGGRGAVDYTIEADALLWQFGADDPEIVGLGVAMITPEPASLALLGLGLGMLGFMRRRKA